MQGQVGTAQSTGVGHEAKRGGWSLGGPTTGSRLSVGILIPLPVPAAAGAAPPAEPGVASLAFLSTAVIAGIALVRPRCSSASRTPLTSRDASNLDTCAVQWACLWSEHGPAVSLNLDT